MRLGENQDRWCLAASIVSFGFTARSTSPSSRFSVHRVVSCSGAWSIVCAIILLSRTRQCCLSFTIMFDVSKKSRNQQSTLFRSMPRDCLVKPERGTCWADLSALFFIPVLFRVTSCGRGLRFFSFTRDRFQILVKRAFVSLVVDLDVFFFLPLPSYSFSIHLFAVLFLPFFFGNRLSSVLKVPSSECFPVIYFGRLIM